MDVDVLTLIDNYVFPVVMCLALFWKLDKDQKTNLEAAERRDQLHREETQGLRASLDNNTAALNSLVQTINSRNNN